LTETLSGGRDAPPRAGAMVESLRGLGYSTGAALADIIDNSLTANARRVELTFVWAGSDSHVVIIDDGDGMTPEALDSAMRLGDRDPLDERDPADLGRFGLGLKTASFSQAQRLTVASRPEGGHVDMLRWDLEVLRADRSGRWTLLEGCHPGSEVRLAAIHDRPQGTAVLWELMDRVVPEGETEGDFLLRIDRIERHLAMVFHRWIESRRLVLTLNGRAIRPWNPFLERRGDTWRTLTDVFMCRGRPVGVQGFVLPHRDRLDRGVWEDAAGPDGWTAQQGFYVYRNERLLVAGSWLGLGRGRSWTKDEAYRLARIRLDLTNASDADWQIDIRKSTARPPVEARARLTAMAETVRDRARQVFAFRSSPVSTGRRPPLVQAWTSNLGRGGPRYRIDPAHPMVAAVIEEAGPLEPAVRAMLQVIEATVPVQQIWLDTAEARDVPRAVEASEPAPEMLAVMERLFRSLTLRKGLSEADARAQLLRTEPFSAWPDRVDALTSSVDGDAP
jgi:hypothetical protein